MFKIDQITIAVTNVRAMVDFYEDVFNIKLQAKDVYGTTLYAGQLAGINLLLCPNELADVDARQNRQQFDYVVDDIDKVLMNVQHAGGQLQGAVVKNEDSIIATVIDPDGNTMVFKQV